MSCLYGSTELASGREGLFVELAIRGLKPTLPPKGWNGQRQKREAGSSAALQNDNKKSKDNCGF
jgi:hypothetical protein